MRAPRIRLLSKQGIDQTGVLMGSQDVTGWLLVVSGALNVGRALSLVRARRSGTRPAAIPAGVWSGLLTGLGLFAGGVLYLRYPHGAGLGWFPRTLAAAG